jgi:hypothetical protein
MSITRVLIWLGMAAGAMQVVPGTSRMAAAGDETIKQLKVYPESLRLDGPRDLRRLIVTGVRADGTPVDLSDQARLAVPEGKLAVDEAGYVRGLADGLHELKVCAADQCVVVPVTVDRSSTTPPVSFVRDVAPLLSRVGCNQGTCHGSAKGKNGFKLSLRGYDLDYDYVQLVDDLAGRRVNRTAPDESLMLLKPTNAVPHQGGYVLDPQTDAYQILRDWIVQGMPNDVGTVARVASVEVHPRVVDLADAGAAQQLLVIAHYPDGTTRDVTRDALWSSSVPDVAAVSPAGKVTAARRGEAAVLVKYEGAMAVANVTVMGDRSGFAWTPLPQFNRIDELVDQKLSRMKIQPSGVCTDEEFLRRVSLDLTGVPPEPARIRAFLADPAESRAKRQRVIDELIGSPEFIAFWTHKWSDLLQVNRKLIGDKATYAFQRWIERAIATNQPYDQMVRELMTASGGATLNPAVNYFRASKEPTVALENATQLFLGIRFSCNKCHDHPFERWTQAQYYGMAAFWGQVGSKPGTLPGDQVVYDTGAGEVKHPKDGRVMPPVFPYEHEGAVLKDGTRREQLASWLTAPQNPYFARSVVNRIWSYFLGKGIIDPVDDIRSTNPPSNPALLDWLERDFIASGFDLRHLMRTIAQSRVYQSSIATNPWNEDDTANFSHALPRRLTAEQLLDAVDLATGRTPKFDGVPAGYRASQLPDSAVGGSFLDLFGRPARESVCECERSSEMSLSQALALVNGPTIAEAIADPQGRLAKLAAAHADPRTIVEEVYLAALSRFPKAEEAAKAAAYLEQSPSPLEGAQDLMWALINSSAFLFNR